MNDQPTSVEITTRQQLTAWLEEECWFDDGRLYGYRPEPSSPVPGDVHLELGRRVAGGFEPGDVVVFRVFRMTAMGVTHFSIEQPGRFQGHWSEGVELEDEGLGFTIDTPGPLRLVFQRLEVVQLDDRHVVVEPAVSDRHVSVSVAEGAMPSAEDWVRMMRDAEVDARRNFCGDHESAAHDPASFRYEGWCLQMRERAALEEALFLYCRTREPTGYWLSIERRGPAGRLWDAVCRATAVDPRAVIRTGNVQLNALQWRRYLDDGVLPDQ